MSVYIKISAYFVAFFVAFKLRTYLSNKLRSNQNNDYNIVQQLVLFFPETQLEAKDCRQQYYMTWLSTNPTSVLCQLLTALKRSRQSLDICLFTITYEPMIRLIRDLSESGVLVRILINAQNITEKFEDKQVLTQSQELVNLFKFGVELKFIGIADDGLMHNKFAISDNHLLINGSLNWSEASIFNSYNDVVLTTDPKLVLTYLRHFNEFWSLR